MQTLALGIDIGGTNTAYGIVNRRGEILTKGSLPTTGHPTVADYIAAIKTVLSPLLDQVGREKCSRCRYRCA
jgi:glucokinase